MASAPGVGHTGQIQQRLELATLPLPAMEHRKHQLGVAHRWQGQEGRPQLQGPKPLQLQVVRRLPAHGAGQHPGLVGGGQLAGGGVDRQDLVAQAAQRGHHLGGARQGDVPFGSRAAGQHGDAHQGR
jgi:hypothetical protein